MASAGFLYTIAMLFFVVGLFIAFIELIITHSLSIEIGILAGLLVVLGVIFTAGGIRFAQKFPTSVIE